MRLRHKCFPVNFAEQYFTEHPWATASVFIVIVLLIFRTTQNSQNYRRFLFRCSEAYSFSLKIRNIHWETTVL